MSHHTLKFHEEDLIRLYYVEGKSYQAIGKIYGKSREAIRLALNEARPNRFAGSEFREFWDTVRREQDAAIKKAEFERIAPRCVICGDKVLRKTGGQGRNRTCSPEHSALWTRARFLLDPVLKQRQRISMAHSVLRNREKHATGAVTWAENILAGKLPVNQESPESTQSNSLAQQAYREVMRIRAEKGYNPDEQIDRPG